jgi:hypothetical protein
MYTRSIEHLVRMLVNQALVIMLLKRSGMPEYNLYRTDVNGFSEVVLTIGEYQFRLYHRQYENESVFYSLTLSDEFWYLLNEIYDDLCELAEGRNYNMKHNIYPEDWNRLLRKILSIREYLRSAPDWTNVETGIKVFWNLAEMLSRYHSILERCYTLK